MQFALGSPSPKRNLRYVSLLQEHKRLRLNKKCLTLQFEPGKIIELLKNTILEMQISNCFNEK